MRDDQYEAARAAGVLFYNHPDKLDGEQIDPLLLPIVKKINSSGWAWSAESCQGHPESASPAWAGNSRPMLRLVTTKPFAGPLLAALLFGSTQKDMDDGSPNGVMLRDHFGAWEIWPKKVGEPWFEILVYWLRSSSVFERNCGIAAFDRFADELLKVRVIA